MEYKKLEPAARKCMSVNATIGGVILLLIIMTANFFLTYDSLQVLFWIITAAAILLIVGLEIVITPKFRYERYRYFIGNDAIKVREGFIWIKETIVPIERLHKIELSQGPIDRKFDLTSILITTAGGDCKIKFINTEEAEAISESLKNKINQIAVEERNRRNG